MLCSSCRGQRLKPQTCAAGRYELMSTEGFTVRKTSMITGMGIAAAAALTFSSTEALAQHHPPPGYEQGSYYVPQSVASSGPRHINDWEEGEPIPRGYHPVHRIRKGL